MKRLLLTLAALPLAACATANRPYAPVDNIRYQALGAEPFWMLTIGDDRIVLRTSRQQGDTIWPRTMPRTESGTRIWQSGEGAGAILIEARPGPCETEGEEVYADNVRVRANGAELTGCGGRLVRARPR